MSLKDVLDIYAYHFEVGDTVRDRTSGQIGVVQDILFDNTGKSGISYGVKFPINSKPFHRFGNEIVKYSEPNSILKDIL